MGEWCFGFGVGRGKVVGEFKGKWLWEGGLLEGEEFLGNRILGLVVILGM